MMLITHSILEKAVILVFCRINQSVSTLTQYICTEIQFFLLNNIITFIMIFYSVTV
jgi:hypothetical protein